MCNLPYILECDIPLSPAVKSHVLPVKIPPPGLCLDSFLSLFSAFPGKIHGGKQHSRLIQDYRRPGFTIEAGSGENPLPLSQFPDIWSDNLGILLGGMTAVL